MKGTLDASLVHPVVGRRLWLECVDCHYTIKGDFDSAIEQMREHVQTQHGRELVYKREQYAKEKWTWNEYAINLSLLRPELTVCA